MRDRVGFPSLLLILLHWSYSKDKWSRVYFKNFIYIDKQTITFMYARFKVHAVDQLDIKILKKYCIPDVYDLFILEQSLQAEFRTQCTDPRDFNDRSHLLDKLHLTFVFSCISQYFVIKWGDSSPRLMSFK